MRLIRLLFRITLVGLFLYAVYFFWQKFEGLTEEKPPVVITTHSTVLQEITAMGKLELVKYTFKDVVEHEVVKEWLPDAKAVLIVSGEAVGCIDLTKIKSTDIIEDTDTVIVYLPDPELCVYKINHDQSKVYDVQYAFMGEAQLVNDAFVAAEKQISKSALKMGILTQTQENAQKMLTPFLEKVSGKKVLVRHRLKADLKELRR
ncbi:DUF4230 domain-containing protein [Rhodocytophaga rosea]|uniref:DUF4230 domain-containing protein n=1 Tax=Rhodocytophaga rosea TaxID=2704465 RepID=A0A6C0GQP1_9BACT|nr:DUF4230 domain-containing protein [Rhodocytophaga rosea]QHT70379.1 DUF4230 domain-containing protein [Rhodocytophaga rosea]